MGPSLTPRRAAHQVRLHRWVTAPLWRVLTPLLLPLATATVAASCARGALHRAEGGAEGGAEGVTFHMSAPPPLALSAANAVCAAAAALSSAVLAVHAAGRIFR
eukprot:1188748-Prorocentrum_minimum.AAC.1